MRGREKECKEGRREWKEEWESTTERRSALVCRAHLDHSLSSSPPHPLQPLSRVLPAATASTLSQPFITMACYTLPLLSRMETFKKYHYQSVDLRSFLTVKLLIVGAL